MDTVIPPAAVIKHAQGIQKGQGRHTVTLPAALHLLLCLCKMGKYGSFILMGQSGKLLKKLLRAGIFRVKAQDIRLQGASVIQLPIHLLHHGRRLAEIVDRSNLNAAHPHIVKGVCNGFRRQIHIKNRCNPAGQIFQHSQPGQLINILPAHFGFHRKNLMVQPFIQGQIIRVGAQERHSGMGVCVLEARHQQIALTVDLPVPFDRITKTSVLCLL